MKSTISNHNFYNNNKKRITIVIIIMSDFKRRKISGDEAVSQYGDNNRMVDAAVMKYSKTELIHEIFLSNV